MFGNTIDLTVNSVVKTLKKINQDNFGSEYLLRETTGELRLKIRHQTEKNLVQGAKTDRHNVELSSLEYPSVSLPLGRLTTVYTVIRSPQGKASVEVDYFNDALATFVAANGVAIVDWES